MALEDNLSTELLFSSAYHNICWSCWIRLQPHQKAWQRESASKTDGNDVFIIYKKLWSPSHIYWVGVIYKSSTLFMLPSWFWPDLLQNMRRIVEILLNIMILDACPCGTLCMVGWFCLTFSPPFNELRDSLYKTAWILPRSPHWLSYTNQSCVFIWPINHRKKLILFVLPSF